ncbi:universal stress protein [Phaeobacter italicus]|jgi:nucleotide-binding universal stress UspA family protein|uniref:Universal stress protein F n=1 Tax=Phaeobacter italicus TaxID=481446 RepID=A0A0H5DB26_9RHOB|nr:universal stress protein [Phaeobacter italicus]EEB71584.1 universal stress protein family protein [Ruegeria sp. R11]MEC8573864.1 universal stress protein [Pseudomonadota bacterium]MBO9440937.1 universal stress protein [Phaeobacter italicus]MBY5975687.1 universal stress protein [Phaeobacter italicus]MBY6042609.1 universal stress protein [Phaeobacter italicus]
MSKSVLCALELNGDATDRKVLTEAARMAELDGAQLDVVNVLPDFGESWVSGFFEEHHHERAIKEANDRLQTLCKEVLGEDRNAKVRHLVATGKAYQEILKVADKAGSDLIVIGAHKPELTDYLLGPNAARVIRHSSCSVYVVR